RGDAGAHERTGVNGTDLVRNQCQALEGHHHEILITAVHRDASDLLVGTRDETPPTARLAVTAISSQPSDADALPGLPPRHLGSNGIDHAGDLMARHAWIGNARPVAFFCQRIAMTEPAGLHFDADLPRSRLRDLSLDQLQRPAGLAHLHCTHDVILRTSRRSMPDECARSGSFPSSRSASRCRSRSQY